MTQLDGDEPASKMLISVSHILEKRRELAHDPFQPSNKFYFAKTVDAIASLYSLFEGKNHRYSSGKGNIIN